MFALTILQTLAALAPIAAALIAAALTALWAYLDVPAPRWQD